LYYGAERGSIEYGTTDVSIPRDHRLGEIERPTLLRAEFREDPQKHVVVLSVRREDEQTFFAGLATEVAASKGKEAFVFVHGYNVTFADAARRTAQIHYDLGYDGAPILYSWPSQGSKIAYPADEATVEWSQPHLKRFLEDVAARSGASIIHLIAHSMGNRALTRAFAGIASERTPQQMRIFKDLVLTAPDIDADVFREEIAPALVRSGVRVTLYASARDKALLASKEFHRAPRAGDAGAGLVVLQGMDTIDASTVETDFLGHSYFAESRTLIGDLYALLRNDHSPAQRVGLEEIALTGGLYYWRFRP
jgi:esterase/lipase superfamily enzyme